MTTKKVQKRGTARKGKVRLSDPAIAARVFKLQRDEPFGSGDYLCVGDLVNDLLQYADADAFSPDIFPHAFTLATRRVERKSGKVAPLAETAYRELSKVLARLDAGETLEEIERKERRRYERQQARHHAALLASEPPKDKTSFDWRIWTLRHIEAGLRSETEAERVEAWDRFWSFFDKFRDTLLSRSEYTAADADEAAALLPFIVGAWQREQKRDKGRK
jgi:hypothetical protein